MTFSLVEETGSLANPIDVAQFIARPIDPFHQRFDDIRENVCQVVLLGLIGGIENGLAIMVIVSIRDLYAIENMHRCPVESATHSQEKSGVPGR